MQGALTVMLTEKQFAVLNTIRVYEGIESQQALAQAANVSVGTVNSVVKEAVQRKWISAKRPYSLSAKGLRQLEPHKVDNAIIMAAGMSTRFAPFSYTRPKGLLKVRGEVLIERQIEQLLDAGIDDITVVVGYKQESFYYLADKYGVDIVVNEEYAQRNNNSTLWAVREKLGNTYICSSDDYFTQNVFEPYVHRAYYSAIYIDGPTDEYCLQTGSHQVITKVNVGGADSWIMLGHVYFDRAFSKRYVQILEQIYDLPETADKLWEDIYIDHIRELPMVMRRYGDGIIWEFDSLDELRGFDPDFIDNVDSAILDNICRVLECNRSDIRHIAPIKHGSYAFTFSFEVDCGQYVYRHPQAAPALRVDYTRESAAHRIARELGLDEAFVAEDPEKGWRIFRRVEGRIPFDAANREHLATAAKLLRTLHTSGRELPFDSRVGETMERIEASLAELGATEFTGFAELSELAHRASELAMSDKIAPVLIHGNAKADNFYLTKKQVLLVGWEHAGRGDYAADLGALIISTGLDIEDVPDLLELYFGRTPTEAEVRHCIAGTAVVAWSRFVHAMYLDETLGRVPTNLMHCYEATKRFGERALELYA